MEESPSNLLNFLVFAGFIPGNYWRAWHFIAWELESGTIPGLRSTLACSGLVCRLLSRCSYPGNTLKGILCTVVFTRKPEADQPANQANS